MDCEKIGCSVSVPLESDIKYNSHSWDWSDERELGFTSTPSCCQRLSDSSNERQPDRKLNNVSHPPSQPPETQLWWGQFRQSVKLRIIFQWWLFLFFNHTRAVSEGKLVRFSFSHVLAWPLFSGGRGRGDEAGPQAAGQTRRPGAHVHQHQQRAVLPQRSVHAGSQGRQLLRVPAQTVAAGGEDGGRVRFYISWVEVLVWERSWIK